MQRKQQGRMGLTLGVTAGLLAEVAALGATPATAATGGSKAKVQMAARDWDRDGIRNRRDRDRDGDGVPNSRDRYPNSPARR
jgi:hypothetical protein